MSRALGLRLGIEKVEGSAVDEGEGGALAQVDGGLVGDGGVGYLHRLFAVGREDLGVEVEAVVSGRREGARSRRPWR